MIRPMLCTARLRAFDHPEWTFELKWDGWRAICTIEDGDVRFRSRHGTDLTRRFRHLRYLAQSVRRRRLVLDGELCVLDERGVPDFERLRREPEAATFVAFDLLAVGRIDHCDRELAWRQVQLRRHVIDSEAIIVSRPTRERGLELYRFVEDDGEIEGIVAKRLASTYRPGRSPDWVKIKPPKWRAITAARVAGDRFKNRED